MIHNSEDQFHYHIFEGQFRYSGRKTEKWSSICSRHRKYQEGCDLCSIGYYVNLVQNKRSNLFYKFCPFLWRIWANRKNSPIRKRLESIFPNLKS